jgi:hypothetical protein
MEIVNVNFLGEGIKVSDYSSVDDNLIRVNYINSSFGDTNDYIERFIYDETNTLLDSDYNFQGYTLGDLAVLGTSKYSSIVLDPESDAKSSGYTRGRVNIQYNFLKTLFASSVASRYWIKDISPSRKEIKLTSQTISGDAMRSGIQSFQSYITTKNYYSDFYLNFGNNNLILAVNAAYIEDTDGNPYILIKLYEPLPFDYDVKSTLWMTDKLSQSVEYLVDIQIEVEDINQQYALRGPNYNVKIIEKIGQTTPYYNYNSLFSANTSSSMQQLMSHYDDKSISINIDYSDFTNFIHFSSATERLKNFQYKIGLIESYYGQITSQQSITGNSSVASSSVQILQNNIDSIINKFDIYDYYLYYSSESFSWPKRTSSKPYQLYSITSSQAIDWIGSEDQLPSGAAMSMLYSASSYDNSNIDNVVNTVPSYLTDDPDNAPYGTFINMIGQHFDNIWVYYKDVSNRYNATNNPKTGISLDLVADAIKSFGIELYTNTNLSDNVYYTLFGVGQSGTLLPPTGSEIIKTYVTSSYDTLPYDQIQKEIYKRIYHNLPYLLKTRGTERGVKALISCYGIPSDILTINQFGGYDRFDKIGVVDVNNDKIRIISQSLELSQSVLSPYSTLQYFDDDNRQNTSVVEIGFSPADQLNREISSSLGYFNIDNLIGNPADQYLNSYPSLESQKNTYFSTYNKKHNVWEYIRLIKYYNNSLFKMVKDFVPARSTVSSGIIIKPHILERNKYARHEPSMSISMHTQSIDMVNISGDHATSYTIDTSVNKSAPTAIGYVNYTSSVGFEKYTGEFQNSQFPARDSNEFNQKSPSNNPTILNTVRLDGNSQGIYFGDTVFFSENTNPRTSPISIQRSATFQNVLNAERSKRFLDVDYSTNPITPVNISTIQNTISRSLVNNESTYNDINAPYAYVQDYNYYIQRSTIPRYYGSKLEALYYNVYSTASKDWKGDTSYGNYSVIERRSKKIALFTQMTTSSFFAGKVNAKLVYLVDNISGLYELNLENKNWFELQNIFKTGKNLTVKQFDNTKYSNQKNTDGIKNIFESGYSYTPIVYYSNAQDKKIYFNFTNAPDVGNEASNNPDPTGSANRFISGTLNPFYTFDPTGIGTTQSIYNIFNNEISDPANAYTPGFGNAGAGGDVQSPTYSIQAPGDYNIKVNLPFNYEVNNDAQSGSVTFLIKKNGLIISSNNYKFTNAGAGLPFEIPILIPSTVQDSRNWRVKVNQDTVDQQKIRFSAEYIGSDRFSYNGKYFMPAGYYTASIGINLIGRTSNYLMPLSSTQVYTDYYASNNIGDPNITTPWTTFTRSALQSPGNPNIRGGLLLINFKFYAYPGGAADDTRQLAQTAVGYINLTADGYGVFQDLYPGDADGSTTIPVPKFNVTVTQINPSI